MNMIKEFYNKLSRDTVRFNSNENPIKMELFLSFLICDFTKSKDHLGSATGWTLYQNTDINLEIQGGIISGQEYLDTIQYGHRLSNGYNNYVNPFFIFDILNIEGRKFFYNYYKYDINQIIFKQEKIAKELYNKAMKEKEILYKMIDEADNLFYSIKGV